MNEQYRCNRCLKPIAEADITEFITHTKKITNPEELSVAVYFCRCGGFMEMKSNESRITAALKIEDELEEKHE